MVEAAPRKKTLPPLSRLKNIKQIEIYKDRVKQRQQELKQMQQSGADPAAIKKLKSLLTKAQKDLSFYQSAERPKDWHSVEGLTRAAERFLESMGGAEEYVDWYDRHRDMVEAIYGSDREWGGGPDLFYDILAALSPRNKVRRNLGMAMTAYNAQKEAALSGNLEEFQHTKQTAPGAMPVHLMNLNRILQGEPLGGEKVPPFAENLKGDVNEVTIDMWMGMLFFGNAQPTPNQILKGKEVVREIALALGKTPRYIQGLLWEMVMRHWGKQDIDFKKAIESVLTEGIGSRRDRKKRTRPLGIDEGQTLPVRGSRRASVEDASVKEMADAITELLRREFGPEVVGE
jgi:hypothetical protein